MKFYYGKMVFEVPESVYYPAEDSLLLAKAVENLKLKGKSVLEIGCGCGFLSVICAKKGATVTAVDINPEAASATKANAGANKAKINVFESDLFSKITGSFDLIIFNAPYLPVEEGETDLTYAGGATGRDVIEKFVNRVKNHLNSEGGVLLAISSLTGEKEVIELFTKQGMTAKVVAREKVSWEELIVVGAFNDKK